MSLSVDQCECHGNQSQQQDYCPFSENTDNTVCLSDSEDLKAASAKNEESEAQTADPSLFSPTRNKQQTSIEYPFQIVAPDEKLDEKADPFSLCQQQSLNNLDELSLPDLGSEVMYAVHNTISESVMFTEADKEKHFEKQGSPQHCLDLTAGPSCDDEAAVFCDFNNLHPQPEVNAATSVSHPWTQLTFPQSTAVSFGSVGNCAFPCTTGYSTSYDKVCGFQVQPLETFLQGEVKSSSSSNASLFGDSGTLIDQSEGLARFATETPVSTNHYNFDNQSFVTDSTVDETCNFLNESAER